MAVIKIPINFRQIIGLLSTRVSVSNSPHSTIVEFKKIFDKYLAEYLEERSRGFNEITTDTIATAGLNQAKKIVQRGGKRVRPYIFYLSYITAQGLFEHDAIRTSVALELFHAFALIHDDIIDKAHERHGEQTIHTHITELVKNYPRGEKGHVGDAVAILCGDLFFSWSQSIIASTGNSELQIIYQRMIDEVVAGQILDVSLMLQNQVSQEILYRKNEYKTALYTFVNPMLMGAAFANNHGYNEFFRSLGLLLGQAFQIQDDLLDVLGNHEKTGKDTFLDIQDGQHTLLTQYIMEGSSQKNKDILMSLFGKPVDDASRKVLSSLFESSGAINHSKIQIEELINKSIDLVNEAPIGEQRKLWLDFINLLGSRNR